MSKYVLKVDMAELRRQYPDYRTAKYHNKFRGTDYLVTKALGSKHVEVSWGSFDPGGGLDPHTHKEFDHIYLPIAGRAEITLDGEKFEMSADTLVYVPAGVEHGFRVLGQDVFRFYCCYGYP
jgi:mannose-6-phosphate isomerase-like protein (cupin superfamily)